MGQHARGDVVAVWGGGGFGLVPALVLGRGEKGGIGDLGVRVWDWRGFWCGAV